MKVKLLGLICCLMIPFLAACSSAQAKGDPDLALIKAAERGQTDQIYRLLQAGANVNATSPNGTTALMMAVRGGHAGVVELLLAKGADVGHRNDAGATALAWATRSGNETIERALRQHGAED